MFKSQTLVKVIKWAAYALPFTLFLFWQSTLHPMATLKTFAILTIVEVMIFAWFLLILYYPQYRPKFNRLLWVFLIFLGVITLTSLFGIDLNRSFWSVPERATGLVFILHLAFMAIALYSIRRDFNWLKYLKINFWVSVGMGVAAFIQYFAPTLFYVTEGSRPGGTLGNPAFLASYLILGAFLGIGLFLDSLKNNQSGKLARWQWLLGVGVLWNIASIFLTETRGAILGLIVGLLVLLVWFAFSKSKGKFVARYILIAIVALGLLITVTSGATIWQKIPGINRLVVTSTADSAVANRLIVWNIAGQAFLERPLTGWGFDNFRYAFDRHYEPTLFRTGFAETYWDRPHNTFLEYLANNGIFGLLSYVGLLAMLAYVFLRKRTAFGVALAGGLVAYAVQNFLIFDSIGSYLFFYILIAYGLSEAAGETISRTEESDGTPSASLRYFRYALIILAVTAGLYFVYTNCKILYANNKNYWGFNYFANSMPGEAVASFKTALLVDEPYKGSVRQTFVSTLQSAVQRLNVPDAGQAVELSLSELKAEIVNHPEYYYNHFLLADSQTVFFQLDPKFLEGAQETTQTAQLLSPGRQGNYYVSSKIKLLQGDAEGAIAEMKKAVDLDQTIGDPHFYYGLLLLEMNRYEDGFREIDLAASYGRRARNASESLVLANYFADAGFYGDAMPLYEFVINARSGDIEARLKYAAVLHYVGLNDEARAQLQKVFELNPNIKNHPQFKVFQSIFDAIGAKY